MASYATVFDGNFGEGMPGRDAVAAEMSFLGVLADMSELHRTAGLRFPPNETV